MTHAEIITAVLTAAAFLKEHDSSCYLAKVFSGEPYRGYIASKKRYFYGVRLHWIATIHQEPVEWMITPGAESDIGAFAELQIYFQI